MLVLTAAAPVRAQRSPDAASEGEPRASDPSEDPSVAQSQRDPVHAGQSQRAGSAAEGSGAQDTRAEDFPDDVADLPPPPAPPEAPAVSPWRPGATAPPGPWSVALAAVASPAQASAFAAQLRSRGFSTGSWVLGAQLDTLRKLTGALSLGLRVGLLTQRFAHYNRAAAFVHSLRIGLVLRLRMLQRGPFSLVGEVEVGGGYGASNLGASTRFRGAPHGGAGLLAGLRLRPGLAAFVGVRYLLLRPELGSESSGDLGGLAATLGLELRP